MVPAEIGIEGSERWLTNLKIGWVTLYTHVGTTQRVEWCFSVGPHFGVHVVCICGIQYFTTRVSKNHSVQFSNLQISPPRVWSESILDISVLAEDELINGLEAGACPQTSDHGPVTFGTRRPRPAPSPCHVSASGNCIACVCWSVNGLCFWEKLPKQAEGRAGWTQQRNLQTMKLSSSQVLFFCSGLPKPFSLTDQLRLLHLWSGCVNEFQKSGSQACSFFYFFFLSEWALWASSN